MSILHEEGESYHRILNDQCPDKYYDFGDANHRGIITGVTFPRWLVIINGFTNSKSSGDYHGRDFPPIRGLMFY